MCIVALKYFKDKGWTGAKNRDRNYRPRIVVKQSFRQDIERLYMYDSNTKYTEGLNEFGTSILSAATLVKNDEKEGQKSSKPRGEEFASPDGKNIRTALLEKDIEDTVNYLIDREFNGNTIIFNQDRAFLLEGALNSEQVFKHEVREIKQSQTIVRTNHGIWLPWAGYQADSEDEHFRYARKSSEARKKQVEKDIKTIEEASHMLDAISDVSNKKDNQMNPIRLRRHAHEHGSSIMLTTGQLMIIPSELTLYYRPIWCTMDLNNINTLERMDSKTFFQPMSMKPIYDKLNMKESTFEEFFAMFGDDEA
ncbi:MAG TPA: hypothetical protein PLA71_00735 [Saccharofermentans sp.]|nr:hypothetical protein [Saccharofermentans sp.]